MNIKNKMIVRYILLFTITIGAFISINSVYHLEIIGKSSMVYGGVIGAYLGVWGYIVKWHYNTKISDDKGE